MEDESQLLVTVCFALDLVGAYLGLAAQHSAHLDAGVGLAQPKALAYVASQEPPGLNWAPRMGLVAAGKLAWAPLAHLRYLPALMRRAWQLRLCPLPGGVASLKPSDSHPMRAAVEYS